MSLFFYRAYNWGISSAWALPELVAAEMQPDVTIRPPLPGESLPTVEQFPAMTPERERRFLRPTALEVFLLWPGVGRCCIRQSCEIIVQPDPGVAEEVLRLHLLGSALGVLLQQRGLTPFHASAVAVDGQAVLFLGPWGMGKSTVAAAMVQRGHPLLADDITALAVTTSGAVVYPAFPQMKLWPASLAMLGTGIDGLPKVHPAFDKRAVRLTNAFSHDPLPVKCIFLLAQGEEPLLQPASAVESLFALLEHWYLTRFGDNFATLAERSALFQLCSRLTRQTPIYWLQRTAALADLPRLLPLIEKQAQV